MYLAKKRVAWLDQPTTNKGNFTNIAYTKYWPKFRKDKQEPDLKFKKQVDNESLKRGMNIMERMITSMKKVDQF